MTYFTSVCRGNRERDPLLSFWRYHQRIGDEVSYALHQCRFRLVRAQRNKRHLHFERAVLYLSLTNFSSSRNTSYMTPIGYPLL